VNNLAEPSDKDLTKTVTNFVCKHSKPYDAHNDNYVREPFASDVKAGKTSSTYNAHSYHTKVPPEGITQFIAHYTQPGDLVLDLFCGTGMTGVAALKENRNVVLIDISPVASFIAFNYCTPFDSESFLKIEKKVQNEIGAVTDWLYETRCSTCGSKAIIEYTVWSEELQCPRCKDSFSLWDVSVKDMRNFSKEFLCPACGKKLNRAKCKRVGTNPVIEVYDCPKCKRKEQKLSKFDVDRLKEIQDRFEAVYATSYVPLEHKELWPVSDDGKPLWFPSLPIMLKGEKWRDTWRSGVHKGFVKVDDFYTKRNLWALAKVWNIISKIEDERIRAALQFVFTSLNPSCVSRLTRYNFRRRGNGSLSGTLYIPSFSAERNLKSIWETKKKSILKLSYAIPQGAESLVATQSATDLSDIPPDSIDYVFTDPPFGSNLMYSELNFIWESWLGKLTNLRDEAIVNRSQSKGIAEYEGLMTKSFKEIYKVLKPGRWMTLVFHNSDGEVWQAIQEGLSNSGFSVAMIGIFDKKQRSFKQVTSTGAVGYDVVINCYKPKATAKNGINGKTTNTAIIGFLADQMLKLPLVQKEERTARMLHSKTIGFFMLQNKPLRNLSFEDFQKILKNNFREIDGHWYLPYQRPKTGSQKRLFGYVSNEAEAIEWLEDLLKIPRKYGDILPDFFKAMGPNKLQKDLQSMLQENFVEEKGAWRNPTSAEKEHLTKKLTDKTARQLSGYLEGTSENVTTDNELCEWIEFCYNNGLFREGSELFSRLNENKVIPDVFKKAKKVAEICKLKLWEGSH
jgi:16S rRNA G966 N2-methylase RsmD/predicted RNA-binding Zn-ribbon protein involved in translation (DUF1610 family)